MKYLFKLIFFLLIIASFSLTVLADDLLPTERMWGPMTDQIKAQLAAIDPEFAEITIDEGINYLYGREDQLDLKMRELCTITILSCMGKHEELNLHLYAGINLGWTPGELREIMLLYSIPAGWPTAIDSIRYFIQWIQDNEDYLKIVRPHDPWISLPDGSSIPASLLPIPKREEPEIGWYETGYEVGKSLFGKILWRKYLSDISKIDPDLADFTVINVYGKLLTRNILTAKTRELCYVAASSAIRDKVTLKLHIVGALNCGATSTEIKEIIYHTSLYAGQDATLQALEVYHKGLLMN